MLTIEERKNDKIIIVMNRLLKRITAIMLTMAMVCMIGCKKTDDPDNGGNNGNNGGNGGEAPEAPAIISTTEVQYDGTVYIEAVFEDGSKLYFSIISPTEVSVVSGEFYYHNSPSIAYLYRGDVIIPENIVHLGKSYSVVAISDKAFYGDELVTSVYIPNSVISIKTYSEWIDSFYGFIYYGAFQGCTNLNSVRMSENIQDIGVKAFAGCPCYKDSVTITKQVKRIGAKAFDSGTVYFNADSCIIAGGQMGSHNEHGDYFSAFPNMNTISYGDNVKVLPAYIYTNCHNWLQIDIPLSVTMVPDKAFYMCRDLEKINGFDHVKCIGDSVFYGCDALTLIELNDSLETINESLFYLCYSLSNVEMPNSVITIEQDAFNGCNSLTEISFPSSISQIKDRAFGGGNIDTSITCMAINPPTLGYHAFGSRIIRVIYAPMSSVEAYKTADGWSEYADVIVGI